MKKLILLSLVAAGSASAVTVSSTTLNQSIVTEGNLGGASVTGSSVAGNVLTVSFLRTGDIDGLGGDDTLAYDVNYTYYTGSTFDGTSVTLGTADAAGAATALATTTSFGGDASFQNGDTVVFDIANIVYTRAEFGQFNDVTFDGFNEISYFGPTTNNTAVIDGTEFSFGGNEDIAVADATELELVGFSTFGNRRFRNLDFSFTVATTVPEPTSSALLGLGGLAMLLRRRR